MARKIEIDFIEWKRTEQHGLQLAEEHLQI